MAKKKEKSTSKNINTNAYIENAGVVMDEEITETLEKNYMPYAMSVIISRAIPEIDGFKPSQRKLLYTMYKMGLLTGNKTKSANVVGQTMKLNPHGDLTIYDTLVRLSRGNEALLHPYIDSKGNFGKSYSRDMAYAASRYTEVKLADICSEVFKDIDKDTVDFVDNYDNTMKEPTLLPVTYPSVLITSTSGIAVAMASSICPFNLQEICETTIELIKNPDHDIMSTLKAPDFPQGGYIIYDEEKFRAICETGRGSIKVRSRYTYDKDNNCIEITEIPPTTTVEVIIDKIIENVKSGRIKEISDVRDETDLKGLKITIDLKRNADHEKLMQRLFKMTTLEDSFACNFNVLIGGMPKVMGIREILTEWVAFRKECVKRGIFFELNKKKEKLHLLKGLEKILLDIDKAIKIVRETKEEKEVVPNLMIGFMIDEVQAEYVAEIKLRNLNEEYILKRTAEIKQLEADIADMEDILKSEKRIKTIIINGLKNVIKRFSQPRRSMLVYVDSEEENSILEEIPDYPVNLFFSKEGYFKKITPQSLRMSSEQKLKQGDEVIQHIEAQNADEILFFTNKCQVYKTSAAEFEDTKASVLGDYIPALLEMDEGEMPIYMANTSDYKGFVLFMFENGKAAKIDLAAYETKTKRKKLLKAYSDKSPLVSITKMNEDGEIIVQTDTGRTIIFDTVLLETKSTKNSIGVKVLSVKKNAKIVSADKFTEGIIEKSDRYRIKDLPSAGLIAK